MIDNQELFKQIPKTIQTWTEQDVAKWFEINDIDIQPNMKLNGKQLLELTPKRMIQQFKFSNFLTRKISDWIQFQTQDFNQYVEQILKKTNNNFSKIPQQQQSIPKNSLNSKIQSANKQRQSIQIQEKLKPLNENLINYKSQQHFRNIPQELFKRKSQDNKAPVKQCYSDDSNVYKPNKYKAAHNHNSNKHSDKKKKFFDNSQNKLPTMNTEKINFQNKSNAKKGVLMLDDLMENSEENTQDVQTCKYIPQKPKNIGINLSDRQNRNLKTQFLQSESSQSQGYQNNVKFISSHLVLAHSSILTMAVNNTIIDILKTTRIGRSMTNEVKLKSDGASRFHAEIIVEEQINEQHQTIKRYYLRDVGSRFGTFVQTDPQKPIKVLEGNEFSIGDYIIRIDKLKISKNKQKFDLSLTTSRTQQQQRTYINKSLITIGNKKPQYLIKQKQPKSQQITKRSNHITSRQKQKRDLQLEDSFIKNYHCRFVLINGEVYFQQVEGNILQKIYKDQRFQFVRNQYLVRFGDQNVTFKLQTLYKTLSNSN